MAEHKQPTQEELDEQIRKSQEEIERIEAESSSESEELEEKEQIEEEVEVEETEEQEEQTPESEEPEEKEDEEQEEEPDYKKKFSESSRESQKNYYAHRKVTDAIAEADGLNPPTDEELTQEAKMKGFEYDDMSDVEKSLFRTSVLNERRLAKITEASKEVRGVQEWVDKVEEYIEDPRIIKENPVLAGKEKEFKEFAELKENRGVNFELLTSAFLYKLQKEAPPKHKGKMFETGNGGSNEKPKPKSDKISLAEAAILKNRDYKKWKEYVDTDKIDYGEL